jgi:uncharacterized membrane protein (UPF0127 family)
MRPPPALAIQNLDRGALLGARVRVAATWWSRARGLLGRRLAEHEGLLLRPCRAVHMLGMREAIDVVFVDGADRVVATYPRLKPGGLTRYHREAESALEVPAGIIDRTGTQVGDRLSFSSTLTEG